jgi:hypothetical protein
MVRFSIWTALVKRLLGPRHGLGFLAPMHPYGDLVTPDQVKAR